MFIKRLVLFVGVVLLGCSLAAAVQAKTYPLNGGGGQLHIGNALALPLQTPATPAVTGTVFPPLLVPVAPALPIISGTTGKPLIVVGGKKGYQHKLTIPASVLSKAAAQTTLGIKAVHPTIFAVATNLGYKWPSAPAVFSTGAVGAPVISAHGGTMTYSNALGARFGGPASFRLSPGAPAGLITTAPATLYIKFNATTPPCTHPVFGGVGTGCLAGLVAAKPTGLMGIGGPTATTVMTPGVVIGGLNFAAVKLGATPLGTILGAVLVASAPVGTNKATSQPGPWTTGQIIISNPIAGGGAEIFTLSGRDDRTAGGRGTIQLVSGSLSKRALTGVNANRGWIRLDLGPPFTRLFEISGNSNGVSWNWSIEVGGTVVASATGVGPIANALGPPVFATTFINSINGNAGVSGCGAASVTNPDDFEITCPSDFEFFVDGCQVGTLLGGGGCAFNPTIFEVVTTVPMLGRWSLVALIGLLLAIPLGLTFRRRSTTGDL